MLRWSLVVLGMSLGCSGDPPAGGDAARPPADVDGDGLVTNDLFDAGADLRAPDDAAVVSEAAVEVAVDALDEPTEDEPDAAGGGDVAEASIDALDGGDAATPLDVAGDPALEPDAPAEPDVAPPDAGPDADDAADDRAGADGEVTEASAPCAPGQVRVCYPGPAGTLGVGACVAGVEVCAMTGWSGACEGSRGPEAERCDGVDDDCDGEVDEGIVPRACGVGACRRSVPACADGRPTTTTCAPGAPAAEVCDGVDNNCNNLVDDGVPAVSCGVGACRRETARCTDGVMEPCFPGAPSPESCDGVDNDCNGRVDDSFPSDARCFNSFLGGLPGRGACTYGAYACVSRAWTCVTLATGLPQREECNGRDDNCNGLVDEGYTTSCTATVGACRRPGTQRCRADGTRFCESELPAPTAEVCNGVDDNCDGRTDEGGAALASAPCAVGLGACERRGVFVCTSGVARCNAAVVAPTGELCDAVDNDCNGVVDDEPTVPRTPCDEVHPWCEHHGTLDCMRGVGVICAGLPRMGTRHYVEVAEVCNGRDDDCNGLVDEIPERQPDGTERPCPP